MSIDRVPVGLGERSYDILVGAGLLARAGETVRPLLRQPRVIIVTDRTVADLHLPALLKSLDDSGIGHHEIVLPPGEETKSFTQYAELAETILALGIERSSVLVAFGGGVIGDLVGFTAATLLRGIDFVQIPTTLLAQVDSSVGGKTAIDTRSGKNLVGAFHQPRLVLADTATLDTLPARQLRAGYAEIVKYGLIGDAAFFQWLEGHAASLLAGDEAARRQAIVVSCRAKAAIVMADEREGGIRALLNLGHTFGHALEAETGFGDALLHGEAIAIGMMLAFELAVEEGLCPPSDAVQLRRHLHSLGLPVAIPRPNGRALSAAALAGHMRKDKKIRDGRVTLILPRRIGDAFITSDIGSERIEAFLAARIAEEA